MKILTKISFCVLVLFVEGFMHINSDSDQRINLLMQYSGLYMGKVPNLTRDMVYVTINNDKALLEYYHPFKGEIMNPYNEKLTLYWENNNSGRNEIILFKSNSSIVFIKNNKLYLKSNVIYHNIIRVKLRKVVNIKLYYEYKNRAYAFHERWKTLELLNKKYKNFNSLDFDRLIGPIPKSEFREKKPEEFVIYYNKKRDSALQEIFKLYNHIDNK